MNQLKVMLKKFAKNKNTVTIIVVIACLLILYIAYSLRIESATKPVTVYYAKYTIQPRTLITEDMIATAKIPSAMLTGKVVRNLPDIVGKYSTFNTMIPAGSMFYSDTLVTWDQMPDSAWADIPTGYTIVSLPVNIETTYGNSIFPGNYIDLYYATTEKATSKLMFGKLIESIEVLAVKDSSGNHVFENSDQLATPSALIFAVPENLHLLLRKASYLSGDLVPVPRNKSYSENPVATHVSSQYIQEYILSQTVSIPDEVIPSLDPNDY